jgi:hypothetical protein
MQIEETPDRRRQEEQTDHHFETPVVREARPGRAAHEERENGDDAGAEQQRPQERGLIRLRTTRRLLTSAPRTARRPARR